MPRLSQIAALVVGVATLVSCSSGRSDEPSDDSLQATLEIEVGRLLDVTELEIEASETTGSEVDPVFRSRFRGEAVTTEDLYEVSGSISGREILTKTASTGDQFQLFGIGRSTLDLGSWSTEFEELEISPQPAGQPLSSFASGTYVISGSTEESELREAEEAERLRLEEAAAAERQRQEEEQQRLQESIQAARSQLVGSWIGTYSCSAGVTGLTLTVTASADGLEAIFDFYPAANSSSRIKDGSFAMSGDAQPTGDFYLDAGDWIDQPSGWITVDMRGSMSNDQKTLSGTIPGCDTFQVDRQ